MTAGTERPARMVRAEAARMVRAQAAGEGAA